MTAGGGPGDGAPGVQTVTAADAGPGGVLLSAEHVTKYFPVRKGVLLQREVARVHAVDDVSFELRAGVRQVHARPLPVPAASAHLGVDPLQRPGHIPAVQEAAPPGPPRDADDLPGSVCLAEPAQAGRHDPRRPAAHPRPGRPLAGRGAGAGTAGARGALTRAREPVPA